MTNKFEIRYKSFLKNQNKKTDKIKNKIFRKLK